ncbi:hypothetical protein G6F56_004822 [Rhizopus delemar]|nr:hypothetical protein G6F56_004822 [Rhizopus delemar]
MPVPSTSSSTDSISHPSADADTDALLNTGINSNTVETHSVHSLEFPLSATNDRLIFMRIDISERFHNFQLAVKAKIIQGSMLTLEEHAFPSDIKESVEKIVKHLINSDPLDLPTYSGPYTRLYASREISTLVEGATLSPTNRVLLTIRNMVEYLPRHVIGDGPQETELVTRHLQSILLPLFEDIDACIIFRWNSVSDNEKLVSTRPDASMNIIRGASLGERVGCGEVKPQYQVFCQIRSK